MPRLEAERDLTRAAAGAGADGKAGERRAVRAAEQDLAVDPKLVARQVRLHDAWRVGRDRKALVPSEEVAIRPAVGQQVEVACPVRRERNGRTVAAAIDVHAIDDRHDIAVAAPT